MDTADMRGREGRGEEVKIEPGTIAPSIPSPPPGTKQTQKALAKPPPPLKNDPNLCGWILRIMDSVA
jgi:hypothetical protein